MSGPVWVVTGERGATAVEYSLLMVLIAVAVVSTVSVLGGHVIDLYDSVVGKF